MLHRVNPQLVIELSDETGSSSLAHQLNSPNNSTVPDFTADSTLGI